MDRYPHKLSISLVGEAKKDNEGNFVTSDPRWEMLCECREEPNGSGRTVVLTDGKAYQYSSIVYLPSISKPELQAGCQIKVEDDSGNLRIQGILLRVSNDRKNSRLWV